MRGALPLALAVLLAGCALPTPAPADDAPPPAFAPLPGTPAADPGWTQAPLVEMPRLLDRDGGLVDGEETWRLTWTPGNVTGRAGEVARVRLDVDPPAGNASAPAFVELGQWARLPDGTTRLEVAAEGGSHDIDVLLGPAADLGVHLRIGDGESCCLYGELSGPALGLLRSGEPATAHARDDALGALPGLDARAEGAHVRGMWVYRSTREFDCDEMARVAGEPVVRDRVLYLFVASAVSDACGGPSPTRTPRVEFEAGPLARGELEVRVHVTEGCFCMPQAWRVERASVFIGGG